MVGSARRRLPRAPQLAGRRSITLAPVTFAALALGGCAIVLGRVYGWTEIVTVGAFFLTLVVFAAVMTIGRTSYAVHLRLGEQDVRVGERAFGSVDVHNEGRRRVLPARIEMRVGHGRAEFAVPMLPAGGAHNELFAIPTRRRSVIIVGPVRSVRADPLGLIRREVTWTDQQELYVHPVTVALAGAAAGVIHDLEGQSRNTLSEDDMNFHALREYVPGDDKRTIHWKSSARAAKLMVRQFEDTRRTHTAVSLNVSPDAWTDEESFELGVAALASFGLQVLRDAMDASLFAGTLTLRTVSPKALLDDSSKIELAPQNAPAEDPAARIGQDAPYCSLAVVVTGGVAGPHELSASAANVPAGVRTIFLRCQVGAASSVTHSGQTSFATLGDLSELGKVLRMAAAA